VIVELSLLCLVSDEDLWKVSPWNARNNINGFGDLPRTATMTMENGNLGRSRSDCRKIVSKLKEFHSRLSFHYDVCKLKWEIRRSPLTS
jgi:hypothetical protein